MTLMHAACATPEPHLVRVLLLIDKGHTPHAIGVGLEDVAGMQCYSYMHYVHSCRCHCVVCV